MNFYTFCPALFRVARKNHLFLVTKSNKTGKQIVLLPEFRGIVVGHF